MNDLLAPMPDSFTFRSTTITSEKDGQYGVTDHLTIRRVAKLVRFPANAVMEGHMLRGTATLEFARSAFGYGPYSALLGAIRNKDAVALNVDLVAIPE